MAVPEQAGPRAGRPRAGRLSPGPATVHPLFPDEAQATVANSAASSGAGAGKVVHLALTDPDSNETAATRSTW